MPLNILKNRCKIEIEEQTMDIEKFNLLKCDFNNKFYTIEYLRSKIEPLKTYNKKPSYDPIIIENEPIHRNEKNTLLPGESDFYPHPSITGVFASELGRIKYYNVIKIQNDIEKISDKTLKKFNALYVDINGTEYIAARIVAEVFLGKFLDDNIVHHITNNYLDNRINNLYPINRNYHSKIHPQFCFEGNDNDVRNQIKKLISDTMKTKEWEESLEYCVPAHYGIDGPLEIELSYENIWVNCPAFRFEFNNINFLFSLRMHSSGKDSIRCSYRKIVNGIGTFEYDDELKYVKKINIIELNYDKNL
jgi:hypothetical protein